MTLSPGKALPVLSVCLTGMLAGCASQAPMRNASGGIDPRYGVAASPRMVADGEPVPKGGGMWMVGKPYTIAGKTYYPSERPYAAVGLASWYGSDFHGRRTANGEVFDRMSISAAHPTMPLPSYARVTNVSNGNSMIVRVNDRGPYHAGRVMDVSEQVAQALDFRRAGTARVRVEYVGRAALAGSDDHKLLATLRSDGGAAALGYDGGATVNAVAGRELPPPIRVGALAPAPVDDDAEELPTASVSSTTKVAAPLPPTRPVDLGTVPGAGVPIAASRTAAVRGRSVQAAWSEEGGASRPRR